MLYCNVILCYVPLLCYGITLLPLCYVVDFVFKSGKNIFFVTKTMPKHDAQKGQLVRAAGCRQREIND